MNFKLGQKVIIFDGKRSSVVQYYTLLEAFYEPSVWSPLIQKMLKINTDSQFIF